MKFLRRWFSDEQRTARANRATIALLKAAKRRANQPDAAAGKVTANPDLGPNSARYYR